MNQTIKRRIVIAGYQKKIIYLTGAVILFFFMSGVGLADYTYVNISNPFLRKVPIAIPVFKNLSESAGGAQMAVEAADLLSDALEFTGYFKMLDRGAFLIKPGQPTIKMPDINFKNWTAIGSELLVTGAYAMRDNQLEMELRLFDTFKETLLVGKRYKGVKRDQRKMIHRFCSDVIFMLTGKRGLFNSKIAFVSTGSGNKEIHACEFDGYHPKQLTRTKHITLSPAWSSDNKWIAYTSFINGKPDLFIRNLREKRGSIVARKGINATPAWVPGQFSLAATLSFSGDQEIYLLTGTGKIIKRLTNSRGIDVSPSFSPDGKQMAFVSQRGGSPQIYIKHLETDQVTRLTFEGRYNTQPSWSPAGDKIAYSAMENGHINIRVINTDGQGLIQLTRDTGNNESPTWSPDASMIAFSSNREGPSRVYIMTSYGTDQRRLLTLPGEQSNPQWSSINANN
jgi:TolB protein